MKKSLIMLTVMVVTLAFVGAAIAQDPFIMGPKVKCDYVKGGKVTGPKCLEVPCKQMVSMPGSPYALVPGTKMVTKLEKTTVYRDLCVGKSKGACPIGCGPCAPLVKWSVNWKTMEECGVYSYPVKTKVPIKKPVALQCKTTILPPDCF